MPDSTMKGQWRDKKTGYTVTVISTTEDSVWYLCDEWRGPQNCCKTVFLAAMEPIITPEEP